MEENILTKKEKQLIYIPVPSTPFFTISPNCTSLSHFLDLFLQDHVKTLSSHLKDSDDLIRNLQEIKMKEGLNLLMLEVTALYSNISHDIGIRGVDHFLEQAPEIPSQQKDFLINGLRLIIEINYFKYDNKIYHQIKGTAIGTRVAPSHANLFIDLFELQNIYSGHPYVVNIALYKKVYRLLVFHLGRN